MDLVNVIQNGETQSVEFKKSLNQMKEGCKALCGMLNTDMGAGMVFFGISPENEIIGIEGNLDSAQRTLAQHIQVKFDPSLICSIKVEDYEGKKIIVISANRSSIIPYYEYDSRAFIKEGSTKRCLSIAEKNILLTKRDRDRHNGPWKCDKCGSIAGSLSSIVITKDGPIKSYKCHCGGEYWPYK